LKIVDGFLSLVSEIDGTLEIDKNGKLTIRDGIHIESVDKNIGNLKIDMKNDIMVIEGDVNDSRKISANVKELTIKGRVYGGIIDVAGDTSVEILQGVVKSKITHNGKGSIKIFGKCSSSSIVSLKGNIEMEDAENCTVIANTSVIKNIHHGNIVSKSATIQNVHNTQQGICHILGEKISIDSLQGGGEVGIILTWVDNESISHKILQKSSRIIELKEEIRTEEKALEQFEADNKASILKHREISQKLNDKENESDENRGVLFLEKKRLFSKVVQKADERRNIIDEKSKELHKLMEEQNILDDTLKNYELHIKNITFSGELLAHSYRRDESQRDLFSIDLKKLLKILHTKTIPTDNEGEKYGKILIQSSGTCNWSAYNNAT